MFAAYQFLKFCGSLEAMANKRRRLEMELEDRVRNWGDEKPDLNAQAALEHRINHCPDLSSTSAATSFLRSWTDRSQLRPAITRSRKSSWHPLPAWGTNAIAAVSQNHRAT